VYERLHRNGVNYVIAGAGSNVIYSLGEPHPDSQTFISQASFATFDFYQDRIELTAINVNGEIIDQTELMTIR
jgi:hypothetical protein